MSVARLNTLRRAAGTGYVLRFVGRRLIRKSRHVVYALDVKDVDAPEWPETAQVHVVDSEQGLHAHPQIAANLQGRNVQYLEGIRRGEAVGVFVLVGNVLAHWVFLMFASRISCCWVSAGGRRYSAMRTPRQRFEARSCKSCHSGNS